MISHLRKDCANHASSLQPNTRHSTDRGFSFRNPEEVASGLEEQEEERGPHVASLGGHPVDVSVGVRRVMVSAGFEAVRVAPKTKT